ncbi:CHAT domain-containing protein [Tahibacter soli]|uniref:CHAT domain-containing protein n=1 Tax=Tahibacter soli TaxID=2983605 RepID=A0A9X3YIU1_9GAMM|nr:CHAT domain-containing tetratricopeptide repeat protein [Tahibacter soli]MDC8013027.1 CHAT domain-containing protein [Tahibacter soli]
MAQKETIRLAARAAWVVILATACAAVHADVPRLADGGTLERTISTGVDDRIAIDANAGPLVVVVAQNGVDLSLQVDGDAHVRNAPTGRWGDELAIVERDAEIVVRTRATGVANARYRVRAFALGGAEGRRLPAPVWRLWAQAYYDAGVDAVAGYPEAAGRLRGVEAALAASADGGGESLREVRLGIANLLRRAMKHDEAIAAYDAMLATLDEREQPQWVMRASNGKGLSLREKAIYPEADAAFARSEAIGDAGHDPFEWVSARNNRCLIKQHLGHLAAARDCYRDVIPAYRKVAPEQVAVPLLNLAAAAAALGEPETALPNFHEALALRRAGTDRVSLGVVLTNLAVFEARTGAWPEALAHSLEAQNVFESIGNTARLAGVLLVRGWIYENLHESSRAREYFNRSLALANKTGDKGAIAAARSVLAGSETDDALAAAAHRDVIDWYAQTGQSEWEIDERLELARRLDALGDAAGRTAELAKIDALLADGASRVQRARAAMLRATVAQREGRDADALVLVDQAIALRVQARQPDGVAAARLAKARIERRAGRADAALAELERALAELRHAERLPGSPVLAANLLDRRGELIDEATDLVLGPEPGTAAIERAWALRGRFASSPAAFAPVDAAQRELLAELRAKVMVLAGASSPRVAAAAKPQDADEQAAVARRIEAIESELDARAAQERRAASRTALSLPALAAALKPGEAFAALALGERRSGAFVVAPDGYRWVTLPRRGVLDAATVESVSRPDASTLAPLSQALVPLAQALGSARRAIIVPDGASHLVPFAALRDGDGRYWVERRSVTLLSEPPSLPAQLRPLAVSAGYPVVVWGSGRTASGRIVADRAVFRSGAKLAPLPGASIELALIETALGESRVSLGDSYARVVAPNAANWVLHVAAHGIASAAHPQASALALPDADGGAFTLLGGGEVDLGKIPPRLVFLNACEGAAGRMFLTQAPSSLASDFLRAGADAALAAAWPVEDAQAARFAQLVYAALEQRSDDAAEALALAQRTVLTRRRGAPPRDWGGYSLLVRPR